MNLQSWVLLIILLLCLAGAITYIVKHKGCSCGGNCANCGKGCCSAETKKQQE